jgi:hypothetical protein
MANSASDGMLGLQNASVIGQNLTFDPRKLKQGKECLLS